MRKEDLIKIALSGGSLVKKYEDAYGANEAEKFMYAHDIKPRQGKHVPCAVVYFYYYTWATKPLGYFKFFCQMSKYVKSFTYRNGALGIRYRTYKLSNFPEYSVEAELQARRILDGQKEKNRKKKIRQKAKRASNARSKESSASSEARTPGRGLQTQTKP